MEKFTTKKGWVPFEQKSMLRLEAGRATFRFRSEADATYYLAELPDFEDEVLAAVGRGEVELEVYGYGPIWIRAESKKRVWMLSDEISQITLPFHGNSHLQIMDRPPKSADVLRLEGLIRQQGAIFQEQMTNMRERLNHADAEKRRLLENAKSRADAGGTDGSGGERVADEVRGDAQKKGGGDDSGGEDKPDKPKVREDKGAD